MCVGLIISLWIARYLGPEQFGLIGFSTAFVSLFSAIASLGAKEIIVRNLVEDPEHSNQTLGSAAVLLTIGGLLAYTFILIGINCIRPDDDEAKVIIAILGGTLILECSKIATYWFESKVESRIVVLIQNGIFIVFAVTKILILTSERSILFLVWTMFFESAATSLAMIYVMHRKGVKINAMNANASRMKQMLRDSWPLIIASVSVMIYIRIDQVMLGQILGDKAVGVFTAASKISEVWYFIPMIIMSSVFPSILNAKKNDSATYEKRMCALYSIMIWLSLIIAIPMTFVSNDLMMFLYGSGYEQSGVVLAIHIWSSLFVFIGVASGAWFIAENRQILSLQRSIFGVTVNLGLNYYLIPKYGAIGAAISTVLAQFAVNFLFDIFQKETRPMFFMKIKAINPINIIGAM